MLSQLLRQRRVEWHPSLRSRRFGSARLSVDIGLAYAYSHTFPIDVTPLLPSARLSLDEGPRGRRQRLRNREAVQRPEAVQMSRWKPNQIDRDELTCLPARNP